jgi:hypothetical protein
VNVPIGRSERWGRGSAGGPPMGGSRSRSEPWDVRAGRARDICYVPFFVRARDICYVPFFVMSRFSLFVMSRFSLCPVFRYVPFFVGSVFRWGCGKSSLVKAGLLPRLGEYAVPVYIEATADETEARLLKGLHKACPRLLRRSTGAPSRQSLSDPAASRSYRMHVGSNILYTYRKISAERSYLCVAI